MQNTTTSNTLFDAIIAAEQTVKDNNASAAFGIDFTTRGRAEERIAVAKAFIRGELGAMDFETFRSFAEYRMARI